MTAKEFLISKGVNLDQDTGFDFTTSELIAYLEEFAALPQKINLSKNFTNRPEQDYQGEKVRTHESESKEGENE